MLAIGTLPFGGEGLWMDLGQISLTSIGRRELFKAVGRGLSNAAAQYAGNRVSNWNGGWIDPLLRVNWISVGLSAADINFGSNAILSGNLRFNFSSGFQSTLTGTISPLNGGGEMIGGIVLGRFK